MEWAEQPLRAIIRTAIDVKLFEKLKEHREGGTPQSSAELAELCGTDAVLMSRMLKHLAAMGVVHEAGPDAYQPTSFSKALTVPVYRDGNLHG